jgi:hypothetical protein
MQGEGASTGLSSSTVAAANDVIGVAAASTPTMRSNNNQGPGPSSGSPSETPRRGQGQYGGGAAAGAQAPGVGGRPAAVDIASTTARDLHLYAKKVRWCSDTFANAPGSDGIMRRLVLDDFGTGLVKGDKVLGGEDSESAASLGEDEEAEDMQRIRVQAHAFEADAGEDLMWMNDIVQQQLTARTEAFDTQSLEIVEDDVEDDGVGVGSKRRPVAEPESRLPEVESPAAMSRPGEEESVASGRTRADTEAPASSCGGDLDDGDFVRPKMRRIEAPSKLLSDANESAHTRITVAINSSSEPAYGCIFPTQDVADAFIRKKFSPVALVPGTKSAPVWACCSTRSAMPRRKLADEKKSEPSAGVVSDDEG